MRSSVPLISAGLRFTYACLAAGVLVHMPTRTLPNAGSRHWVQVAALCWAISWASNQANAGPLSLRHPHRCACRLRHNVVMRSLCPYSPGSLAWDGLDAPGHAALALGPAFAGGNQQRRGRADAHERAAAEDDAAAAGAARRGDLGGAGPCIAAAGGCRGGPGRVRARCGMPATLTPIPGARIAAAHAEEGQHMCAPGAAQLQSSQLASVHALHFSVFAKEPASGLITTGHGDTCSALHALAQKPSRRRLGQV